mgnify:CR=1 FL=1
MNQHTPEEIKAFLASLPWGTGIKVTVYSPTRFDVYDMYESPRITLDILVQMREFFGAPTDTNDNINSSGCETCDYGSRYGFEFVVKEADLPTKGVPTP